jgi:hypothetical protein
VSGADQRAATGLREPDWTAAIDTDGIPRPLDEAAVAEITGLLPASTMAAYHAGTRVIVRRERPQPRAQLDLIEHDARHRTSASRTASASAATPALDGAQAAARRPS